MKRRLCSMGKQCQKGARIVVMIVYASALGSHFYACLNTNPYSQNISKKNNDQYKSRPRKAGAEKDQHFQWQSAFSSLHSFSSSIFALNPISIVDDRNVVLMADG